MQTSRRRNETETHRGRDWPAVAIHGRRRGGWGVAVGLWTLVGSLERHGTGDRRGRGNPHGATRDRHGCRWRRVRIFLRDAPGEPEIGGMMSNAILIGGSGAVVTAIGFVLARRAQDAEWRTDPWDVAG